MGVQAEQVTEFLTDLRDEGFDVSVSDFIRANKLLLGLVAQEKAPESLSAFAEKIGVLICRDPADQERYNDYLAECFPDSHIVHTPVEAPQLRRQRSTDDDPAAIELSRAGRKQSIASWAFAIFSIIVAIFFIVGGFGDTDTTTPVQEPIDETTYFDSRQWRDALEGVDRWLIAAVPLLAMFALLWYRSRQSRMLQRRFGAPTSNPDFIDLVGKIGRLFSGDSIAGSLAPLRLHRLARTNKIHITRSVRETIREGGFPQFRFRDRPISPDYIVISRNRGNPFTDELIESLIDRLRDEAINVRAFQFTRTGDALVSKDASGDVSPEPLEDLRSRFADHRLIVIDDGRFLFDPQTLELDPVADVLAEWPEAVIASFVPEAKFGYREQLLKEAGFKVISLTSDPELSDFGSAFVEGHRQARKPVVEGDYPRSLVRRESRWVQPTPPPDRDVDRLMVELDAYLDDATAYWLQAVAVFPRVIPEVTRFLGEQLSGEDGRPLLSHPSYLKISRLPWLRRRYMPDWLRSRLIEKLSEEREANVRAVMLQMMCGEEPTDDASETQIIPLEVIRRDQGAWTRHVMNLAKNAPAGSPLREQLFVDFLAPLADNRLALSLPRELLARMQRVVGADAWTIGALGLASFLIVLFMQTPGAIGMLANWLAPVASILLGVTVYNVLTSVAFWGGLGALVWWLFDFVREKDSAHANRLSRLGATAFVRIVGAASALLLIAGILEPGVYSDQGYQSQQGDVIEVRVGPMHTLLLGVFGLGTFWLRGFVSPVPRQTGWQPPLFMSLLTIRRPWQAALTAWAGAVALSMVLPLLVGNRLVYDADTFAMTIFADFDADSLLHPAVWIPALALALLGGYRSTIGGWTVAFSAAAAAVLGMLTIEGVESILPIGEVTIEIRWIAGLAGVLAALVWHRRLSLKDALLSVTSVCAVTLGIVFLFAAGGDEMPAFFVPPAAAVAIGLHGLWPQMRGTNGLSLIRVLLLSSVPPAMSFGFGWLLIWFFEEVSPDFNLFSVNFILCSFQILPLITIALAVRYFAQPRRVIGPPVAPAGWDWSERPLHAWLLLPLLLVLNVSLSPLYQYSSLQTAMPIAAVWLGARHGKTGLLVLGLGMLPSVVNYSFSETLTVGNAMSQVVLSLALCRFAGDEGLRKRFLTGFNPRLYTIGILVLALPISWNFFLTDRLAVSWSGFWPLTLFLFALGVNRVKLRRWVAFLAIAWLLGTFGISEPGLVLFTNAFYVFYELSGINSGLFAFASAFVLGAIVHRQLTSQGLSAREALPWQTVAAVMVAILVLPAIFTFASVHFLDGVWSPLVGYKGSDLGYLGSFVAGLLLRQRGLMLVVGSAVLTAALFAFIPDNAAFYRDTELELPWLPFLMWIPFAVLGTYSVPHFSAAFERPR